MFRNLFKIGNLPFLERHWLSLCYLAIGNSPFSF